MQYTLPGMSHHCQTGHVNKYRRKLNNLQNPRNPNKAKTYRLGKVHFDGSFSSFDSLSNELFIAVFSVGELSTVIV